VGYTPCAQGRLFLIGGRRKISIPECRATTEFFCASYLRSRDVLRTIYVERLAQIVLNIVFENPISVCFTYRAFTLSLNAPNSLFQEGVIRTPLINHTLHIKRLRDTIAASVYRIEYIHNVKAPLLVLQGDNDPRVPKEESQQVIDLLKKDGKTVDVHYYPNEGHGFLKRENQIDSLRRIIDWFDKYLKGQP
jgi:acetyl esterase/lipase